MLTPVRESTRTFSGIINSGLNHPNFIGRFVSFGILYGALYLAIPKIYSLAMPTIRTVLNNLNVLPKIKLRKNLQVNSEDTKKITEVVNQVICVECHKKICEEIYRKIDFPNPNLAYNNFGSENQDENLTAGND